jgi:hypothetical protein
MFVNAHVKISIDKEYYTMRRRTTVILSAILMVPTISSSWGDFGVGYFSPTEDKTGSAYSFGAAAHAAYGEHNILPSIGAGFAAVAVETVLGTTETMFPFYIEPRFYVRMDDDWKLFFHGGGALGFAFLGGSLPVDNGIYVTPELGLDYWINNDVGSPLGFGIQTKYANYKIGGDWWQFYGFDISVLAVGGCGR